MWKDLFSKYQNQIRFQGGLVSFSLLSYLTTKLFIMDNLWYNLLPLYPIFIIFIVFLYLAIKELYIRLKIKIQLVDYIKTAHYQCQIVNDKGDLHVICKIMIKNISANILEWLPEERIRIRCPTESKIPSSITTSHEDRKVIIDHAYNFKDHIDDRECYTYVWMPRLIPGLGRSSSFTYEWTIDNIKECELDAFKRNGSFHVKVNQFYERFSAEIIAPPNYRIGLIEKYVIDFSNQRIADESKKMATPSFNEVRNIMIIDQHRPLPKASYVYKYELIALDQRISGSY